MNKEIELAEKFIKTSKESGVPFDRKYKATLIDYEYYFADGKLNFRLFVDALDDMGYDVLPLDCTPFASLRLKGHLVAQNRERTAK